MIFKRSSELCETLSSSLHAGNELADPILACTPADGATGADGMIGLGLFA